MKKTKLLFWQPSYDILRILNKHNFGRFLIIFFNYAIWLYLFYVSYLLVRGNTNVFWQLLIATIIGECIEKYGKGHALWRRPMFQKNDQTPPGLVDRWYKTGSFPSGHTIKAVYFFLFILQYHTLSPTVYLSVVVPLITLRVLAGFHYPIDILGGAIFGSISWLISRQIIFPEFLTEIIRVIFNFIFMVRI